MSLINDALKRAKQAQQKSLAPLPAAAAAPASRAVEPARLHENGWRGLLPFGLGLLIVAGALISWFVLQSNAMRKSPPNPVPVKPQPVAHTTPAAAPSASEEKLKLAKQDNVIPNAPIQNAKPVAPVAAPNPGSSAATPVTSVPNASLSPPTGPVAAEVAPNTMVANVPPATPALPKLQGIFYRPERPAALVDGKMVLVGRMSGDYRIVAISQQTVTVVRAGQTNVLEMPD